MKKEKPKSSHQGDAGGSDVTRSASCRTLSKRQMIQAQRGMEGGFRPLWGQAGDTNARGSLGDHGRHAPFTYQEAPALQASAAGFLILGERPRNSHFYVLSQNLPMLQLSLEKI